MVKEKTDDEAWGETISYLEKKAEEKRRKGLKRIGIIHTLIVGSVWIIFVALYFYLGLKSGIDMIDLILIGFLMIFGGLFVVLRVYFVGLIWSPFLFLLDVYVRIRYRDKDREMEIIDKMDFLWFLTMIFGTIGVILMYFFIFTIRSIIELPDYLFILVIDIYMLMLLCFVTSKSLKLKKSG